MVNVFAPLFFSAREEEEEEEEEDDDDDDNKGSTKAIITFVFFGRVSTQKRIRERRHQSSVLKEERIQRIAGFF